MNPDAIPPPDVPILKRPGDLIRASLEIRVRPFLIVIPQRGPVGMMLGGAFQELMEEVGHDVAHRPSKRAIVLRWMSEVPP